MKYINLHTHGKYSDGQGELIEFVESAINKNMAGIGFSSHTPIPYDNNWSMKLKDINEYRADVNNLKKLYKNKIKVYLGLELDYIESIDIKKYINFDKLNLDYYIAAVHYIYSATLKKHETVDDNGKDFENVLINGFNNNIIELYTKYYETYREMIKEYKPSLLAHLDVVKKNNVNNKYFNENDKEYINQVILTLDEIKKHDCIVEINTGGLQRGYTSDTYPSLWILKECQKRNIKITISADAHVKENVNYMFDFAIANAKKAGYKHIYTFNGTLFKPQSI